MPTKPASTVSRSRWGSSHAMTDRTAQLDHDLIAVLRDAVAIPLVLHGSSGVADDELARAVSNGIVKVNVGTILNVAFTGAIRTHIENHLDVVDPRNYLTRARDDLAAVVTRMIAAVAAPSSRPAQSSPT